MEQKTNVVLNEALKSFGDDSDIMIVAHSKGQCASVIHGNHELIAQAIFACIHQPNNPIGMALYDIIKLNSLNIVRNPTRIAEDLLSSMEQLLQEQADGIALDEDGEEIEEHLMPLMQPVITGQA